MQTTTIRNGAARALATLLVIAAPAFADGSRRLPPIIHADNATGVSETFSTTGAIDVANPFFRSLGGNGRA